MDEAAGGQDRGMPADPNEPTRVVRERAPLPPAGAPLPPPRVPVAGAPYAAAPVGVVDPAWAARAEDRLRTLRTLLTLMSLVSVAAIGVAIWALTANDEQAGTQGASRGRVAALTDRVERLEDRPARTTPSGDQVSASELAAVQEKVDALEAQVADGGGQGSDAASSQSVTQLATRVDRLSADLDELRNAAAQGGGTETTP